MNKLLKTSIKVILSLAILIILLYNIDLKQLASTASQFNWLLLVPLVAILFLSICVGGLNVNIFLRALKEKVSLIKTIKYYILSWAYGLIIPGKIGELSIIYFLNKDGVSIGKGALIAMLDKIITFICFFIIALFGIFTFFALNDALLIVGIILLAFIIFAVLMITDKGRYFIKRYILKKYSKLFIGFSSNMKFLAKEKKMAIFLNIILTFIKLLLTTLFVWLAFIAFNSSAGFIEALIVTATTTIVSLIPISIGGLGVRETTGVVLFLEYGVAASISAAVFFFYAIVRYAIAAIFALYDIFKR